MPQFQPQIEWRSPCDIKPYGRNNKKHGQSAIDKLADLIRKFGWDVPIVVDESGCIIKGHRRHQAALKLKLKQVPVIVRSDLTAEEVRAARIADNRLSEDSGYDLGAIAIEIEELNLLDVDLSLTGFDVSEIDKFLEGTAVDYQPSQVFGSNENWTVMSPDAAVAQLKQQAAEDADDEESEPDPYDPEPQGEGEDGEPDPDRYKVPQEKFPLAIVLNSTGAAKWKAYKESIGVKRDSAAFETILEQL